MREDDSTLTDEEVGHVVALMRLEGWAYGFGERTSVYIAQVKGEDWYRTWVQRWPLSTRIMEYRRIWKAFPSQAFPAAPYTPYPSEH